MFEELHEPTARAANGHTEEPPAVIGNGGNRQGAIAGKDTDGRDEAVLDREVEHGSDARTSGRRATPRISIPDLVVGLWVGLLKRDRLTGRHCLRVARTAFSLSRELGLPEPPVRDEFRSGPSLDFHGGETG